ncbi:hypothetical protein SESBI_11650 [Sesbania bispinosa]|nr:hypothetical protein SESBI_11650 [Sesbania bispinosa]
MYQGASKKDKLPRRSSDIHLGNTRDKAVQNFHQNNCGAIETGVSSAEKYFTSSLKASTELPSRSFEFYVWSDEGINLHVDLNSSPSDWSNMFRNEVCAKENVYRKESGSLWQDLDCLRERSTQGKSSFLWNTNSGQITDHNGHTKSSSSLKLAKDDVAGSDQQNKGGSPLIYDSLTPCSITVNVAKNVKENQSTVSAELTVKVADNLKEYESTVSAEVSYGAPNNYISGAESCAKDLSKKILDFDATGTSFIKSICDSVGNSPSDPGTLERHNSKTDNEISEDCAMLNGFCSVNPDMEVGKFDNGRESSECSQFDDPLKKSGLECGDQESKMKLRKKRKHMDAEVQGSSDKPAARFLRSMKNIALTVQPRRSMRLISNSKVLLIIF